MIKMIKKMMNKPVDKLSYSRINGIIKRLVLRINRIKNTHKRNHPYIPIVTNIKNPVVSKAKLWIKNTLRVTQLVPAWSACHTMHSNNANAMTLSALLQLQTSFVRGKFVEASSQIFHRESGDPRSGQFITRGLI